MGKHQNAKSNRTVRAAVLTVPDVRNFDADRGGQCVHQLLRVDDAEVSDVHYIIVKDEKVAIATQVKKWLEENIDVVITTGGTGIAQYDVTIEIVKPPLTRGIDSFGELFKYLSYVEDVGTRVLSFRAIVSTVNNKLIFSILGSAGAVKLVLEKLTRSELNHLIHELTK